jgi:hypothetical protein
LNLYTYKEINCGFTILCHDHNTKLVKSTINSLKVNYSGSPYNCVADDSVNTDDLKELKALCPTYKAKNTFSSLINVAMKNAPAEWNFLIIAGSWVRPKLHHKFSYFLESEKDIMFPIAEGKTNFVDATINGLFFHKKIFKEVGNLATENPLELCKLMWALDAIDKGYRFKAIAGCKIC